MKKPLKYIDVTDFLHWSGNFTGIQRVVYNLAKQVMATEQHVSLVVYTEGHYRQLTQSLDSLIKEGLRVRHVHIPTREEKLKVRLLGVYGSLPRALQITGTLLLPAGRRLYRNLTPIARKLLHIIRIQEKKFHWHKVEEYVWVPDHEDYGKAVQFTPNDTLIIFGCLWEDMGHLSAAVNVARHNNAALVVLIYDLIPIYHAHTFGEGLLPVYAEYLFETLSVADYVFAISESSANDTMNFMRETGITNKPVVQVIRLGDSLPIKSTRTYTLQMAERYKKPFMICVGTIEARKNHILLYKSLKLAAAQGVIGRLPHLYVIGRRGWLAQDVEHFLRNDEAVRRQITILNDVLDKDLSWFYANAEFSVYPSQYEGWGLPVAESLVYGTPCITSNSSSMVEIAPNLVDMVSPYDPAALLQAMLKYSNSSFIAEKRQLISDHYSPTTWQQTEQQVMMTLAARPRPSFSKTEFEPMPTSSNDLELLSV